MVLLSALRGSFRLPFSKSLYISTLYDITVTSKSTKSRFGCCCPQHIANTAKSSSPAKWHKQRDGQRGKILQKSKSRRNSLVLTYRLQSLWFSLLSFLIVGLRSKKGRGKKGTGKVSWLACRVWWVTSPK